ncbi:Sensor histidine kinase YycG [Ruegeria denitrificans]|uniref:histidine kinase n=1 Tax=Ruegeria denitrificans TaxID=1715692 RepID=A0A0P1I5D8_9RHOB|nr:ATP-binding protein [Ruegeria denitrificans]CUJ90904.1 Sensor histidine kinase YycG [Ruegeria denitrificans]
MTAIDPAQPDRSTGEPENRLLQNIKDYTAMSFALLWQRQAIFLATTILTGFFFDPVNALLFYGVILICEVQDLMLAKRVPRLGPDQHKAIAMMVAWILLNTILSSTAICLYAVSVAFKQPVGGHFTPLFFLFAAALFAAMNNHQFVWAMSVRLAMYGVSFMVIVVKDIWVERPELSSDLWLQFFTVIFVMYFLIDCSLVFLKLYRKNLEQLEKLKEEHERTKAAYIAKSQFISTVSHELRTPLTSIKGSLDLLNTGALGEIPEPMQNLVLLASKNSERLASLINDVLDIQKMEAGEMNYRERKIEVHELVREAISCNLGYVSAHNVEITEDIRGSGNVYVRADAMRLLQVLANMISNAAKFSREGGEITAGCERVGKNVRIFVKDQGIGIPKGSREKVFDRFSQIDSSDERHAGGTGLGMHISKEIVEHFGGIIDYKSVLGKGTEFFIELPMLESKAIETNKQLRTLKTGVVSSR